jgi:hypothetical protein
MHLKLECIGDDENQKLRALTQLAAKATGESRVFRLDLRRPWVARIVGLDSKFEFARKFVKGEKCYLEANSVGSRGVFMHYELDDGVYDVYELVSWIRSRRCFMRVTSETAVEIERGEVLLWAKNQ